MRDYTWQLHFNEKNEGVIQCLDLDGKVKIMIVVPNESDAASIATSLAMSKARPA
jgi:hypothetical protein